MIRKIITIDEARCDGCGLCAKACHEGAIGIVDGKAKLLRDDYCDGLGDCLPACPQNAISFENREAPAYNAAAVPAAKKAKETPRPVSACQAMPQGQTDVPGSLQNFPVQLKLLPPNAPWFEGADLLIAADCTAYAYCNFHRDLMQGKVTVIGCPKLDGVDYSEKLTHIFQNNNIRSVTVVRMTVPCCGGISHWTKQAIAQSGKDISLEIITVSPDGKRS